MFTPPIGRPRTYAVATIFALACLLALPVSAADWAGNETTVDGVLTVHNPTTPVEPPARVDMKELWRIGGDTDDDDEFFGVIAKVITDADGNVYLLDTQLHEIKVFSPSGSFIRSMGAEGEGPGEFTFATDMFITPSGNVGVMQAFPPKVVQFSKEGTPLSNFQIPESDDPGFRFLINARSAGDHLVIAAGNSVPSEGNLEQTRYLAAVTQEEETVRYHSEKRELNLADIVIDESKWDTFDRRWEVGPDGRVYAVLEQGKYRIHVWNEDGSLDRVVERAYEPLARTDEELERTREIYESFSRMFGGANARMELRNEHRGVEQFYLRDDNSLWVLTSQGARRNPEGTIGTFDVFSPEGRFMKQVSLSGEGYAVEDAYFFVGNRVYVVKDFLNAALASIGGGPDAESGEEPEPMSIICYMLDDDVVAMK